MLFPAMLPAQNDKSIAHAIDSIKVIKNDSIRNESLYLFTKEQASEYPGHSIEVGNILIEEGKRLYKDKYKCYGIRLLGQSYEAMFEYPKALNYYFNALDIAQKNNDYSF